MPFKSPKNVMLKDSLFKSTKIAALLFTLLAASVFPFVSFAQTRTFNYVGRIPVLDSTSVSNMVIRADGRYLFYSAGGSAWYVLDLLDMSHISDPVQVDAAVIGLALSTDGSTLLVTTTKGQQPFGVAEPFAPTTGTKIERNSSETGLWVSACQGGDGVIYILEKGGSPAEHQIRTIQAGTLGVSPTTWISRFTNNSEIQPIDIQCTKSKVFIFARRAQTTTESEFLVNTLDGPGAVNLLRDLNLTSSDPSHYQLGNYVMLSPQDSILAIFNRANSAADPAQRISDSVARVMDGSLQLSPNSPIFNLGSQAKGAAYFQEGETFNYGFFVGLDYLKSISAPPANQLLLVNAATFTPASSGTQIPKEDRGAGSALVGQKTPTLVVPTKSDYTYLSSESTGISLVSKAPKLELVSVLESDSTSPATLTSPVNLKASGPIRIKLKSDLNVTFQIRFDAAAFKSKGDNSGLQPLSYGRLVKEGSLQANVEKEVELNVSDLQISDEGTHPLLITAWEPTSGQTLFARTGFRIAYDPPPQPVKNLRLKIGSQSVHVYFDAPKGGDISSFFIFASYDRAALDALNLSDPASILPAQAKTFATGVESYTITSPVTVAADGWKGKYVLHPLQNGTEIYVRVQSIDKSGQLGLDPAAAIAATPYETLTLPNALGSPQSCQMNPRLPAPPGPYGHLNQILWIVTALFSCLWLRRSI